jgi:hypothetical protein
MRLLAIIIVCFNFLFRIEASPQAPDFLIIGKDTFSIYFLPLNHLDTIKQNEFYQNLQGQNKILQFSFNLWRGYQAYWQLIDNKLYLVNLKGYSNSDSVLKATFPDYYNNEKVLAYWFSSYLAIGKDKMLKWDGIFSKTYLKEDILDFKNGVLINRKLVDNYIHVNNGISRLDSNRKNITDTIFSLIKKLNWKKLSECDCDDKYLISIGDKGKIDNIELIPYTNNKDTSSMEIKDHKKCIRKFKRQLKNLQFDIVNWNGKPFEEKYHFEMFYTVEGELENWTN